MGEATTYLSNKILDHVNNIATFTQPSGLYLGLISAVTDGDAGTVTELAVANGYAREVISFSAPAAKAMDNDVAIEFACITTDWSTVTHFGVWDASTGGNLLWWGTMTNFTLEVGKTYTVAVDGVSVGLANKFTTYLSHAMLTHIDNGTAYTAPTSNNLALFSTATDDSGGGTELTGNNYSRQDCDFGTAAAEVASNATQIQFSATPSAWTGATYAAIYDQTTNMLFHTSIGETWTVNGGETLTIAVGDLDLSLE